MRGNLGDFHHPGTLGTQIPLKGPQICPPPAPATRSIGIYEHANSLDWPLGGAGVMFPLQRWACGWWLPVFAPLGLRWGVCIFGSVPPYDLWTLRRETDSRVRSGSWVSDHPPTRCVFLTPPDLRPCARRGWGPPLFRTALKEYDVPVSPTSPIEMEPVWWRRCWAS